MTKFYVYQHIDPRTNEVVYVGKGCGGRAWDITRSRGEHKEHQNWMIDLTNLGYVPSDWVFIYQKNLCEQDAFSIEKNLLHSLGVLPFNRQTGERQHQAKLTNKQALEVFQLRNDGLTHKEISSKFGVSRSAISMLLSGKQWKAVTLGVRD